MTGRTFSLPNVQLRQAILFSLCSSFCFTAMIALSKISLIHSSINQVAFFKNLFSIILSLIAVWICKGPLSIMQFLHTKQPKLHLIRSLSGQATIYLFLLSLRSLPLAEANLLFNTTPMFVPIIAYIWKKHPINHKIWPGLLIAFFGMLFLLHPEGHWENIGLWSALFAGAIGAVTIIAVHVSHSTEPVFRSIFYYGFFSFIVSTIAYAQEGYDFSPCTNLSLLIPLLGVGITGFLCQCFFALSVRHAPASFIAPLAYLSVIFGLVLDLFLWDVHILPSEIAGMTLIILGLFFILSLLKKDPHFLTQSIELSKNR